MAARLFACGIAILYVTSLPLACHGQAATTRFSGVAVSEPIPTNNQVIAFGLLFPVGPINIVQNLFSLSSAEVSDLDNFFTTYLSYQLGITLHPAVQEALHILQFVSIQPSGNGFEALPLLEGPPNAIITPFIRSPQLLPSKLFAKTPNPAANADSFTLVEGGYTLYPIINLDLGPKVGVIPNNTFLNASLLQWVGDKTNITYRIKSSKPVPLPPGAGIRFDAVGYPGSQYVSLGEGQVQAAYSIVPEDGSDKLFRVRWTTTHSHPGFT